MSFCLYKIVAKTIFYSLAAPVRKILFCCSKIKFISSRHRVISSMYFAHAIEARKAQIIKHIKNIIIGRQYERGLFRSTVSRTRPSCNTSDRYIIIGRSLIAPIWYVFSYITNIVFEGFKAWAKGECGHMIYWEYLSPGDLEQNEISSKSKSWGLLVPERLIIVTSYVKWPKIENKGNWPANLLCLDK